MRLEQLNYDIGNFAINRGQLSKADGDRWYLGKPKKSKPYSLPSGPFKGKAEEFESHIMDQKK
jgi:hypothetical protein